MVPDGSLINPVTPRLAPCPKVILPVLSIVIRPPPSVSTPAPIAVVMSLAVSVTSPVRVLKLLTPASVVTNSVPFQRSTASATTVVLFQMGIFFQAAPLEK